MQRLMLLMFGLVFFQVAKSQSVGIGTKLPDASALLDIYSTSKGLLVPHMTLDQRNLIAKPATGLLLYQTDNTQGFYYNTGTPASPSWQRVSTGTGWGLSGNSGTNAASNFIGTTDNRPLRFRINNTFAGELNPITGNAFYGHGAGQNNTGYSNVAIGKHAFAANTTGHNMVAIGDSALFYSTGGSQNTAIGSKALLSSTSSFGNTAIGFEAMYDISGGYNNTAVGAYAMRSNLGQQNTAVGYQALYANTNGLGNTAVGYKSLYNSVDGHDNVGIGNFALEGTTNGSYNISIGSLTQSDNNAGDNNIAIGFTALQANSNSDNIGIGRGALRNTTNSQYNTVIGSYSGDTYNLGYNNTIVGANCDVNGAGYYNCVAIGQAVTNTASSQARIGNAATVSIGGYAGWSDISDGRYKKDIHDDVKGIDFIMKLRPVTYHLDVSGLSNKLNESRGKGIQAANRQAIAEKEKIIFSGFVAQEVEKAAAETRYDFSGIDKPKNENDLYGLRYAEFVVPLVKAMQEQQKMIEKLQQENLTLKKAIDQQQQKINEIAGNKK